MLLLTENAFILHEGISVNRLEEDLKAFDPLMIKLKEQNIAYWFGYVHKDQTGRMMQQLDSLLQACKIDGAHSSERQPTFHT